MSSINREEDFSSPTTALRFFIRQFAKHELHTGLPGIVETYDRNTRRARIVPALRMVKNVDEDGNDLPPGVDGEAVARALAVNVPVLFPSCAAGILHFPLVKGDTGWLKFSERGLTEFKQSGEISTPDKSRLFDESDAVFEPCDFGTTQVTPAAEGATFQTLDGGVHVEIHDDRVVIRKGEQHVTITDEGLDADISGDVAIAATGTARVSASQINLDGNVSISGNLTVAGDLGANGGEFNHQGRNVGASHVHPGVQPGAGSSGPPT